MERGVEIISVPPWLSIVLSHKIIYITNIVPKVITVKEAYIYIVQGITYPVLMHCERLQKNAPVAIQL